MRREFGIGMNKNVRLTKSWGKKIYHIINKLPAFQSNFSNVKTKPYWRIDRKFAQAIDEQEL